MKVATIVGARPQFIKAAAVSRRLRKRHQEVLIHTGQHYDEGMSAVFFRELDIPEPEYSLGVGSASHGLQTGRMLEGIEGVLLHEKVDAVIVYGDTNSTLAGALAAAKLLIPVAHVEAGLRSFNRQMPEEINRVLTDHMSKLLLCPSEHAAAQLEREGIQDGVHVIGDVMAVAFADAAERAAHFASGLEAFGVEPGQYWLATIHRAENTDVRSNLCHILEALSALGTPESPILFPVHPRTKAAIKSLGWQPTAGVRMLDPLGYLDMVRLQTAARGILTDSGGVQKEAYWAGVPCTTLRNETEWVETLEYGWNVLAGTDVDRILSSARREKPATPRVDLYQNGAAADRAVELVGALAQ